MLAMAAVCIREKAEGKEKKEMGGADVMSYGLKWTADWLFGPYNVRE